MAEYLNTTCSICGKKYHVCADCSTTTSYTPWRKIACSTDCYKIFMAIQAYTNGYATKAETRDKICTCDLSRLDTFQDNIQNIIRELQKEDTKES